MEQLPKIAQQGLGGTAKPVVHPDPDLLTAFAEKSLNDRERSDVLQHLAECADCREVVALAMPELPSAPLPSLEPSSWLRWPVMRWGALAACVVVVGAAVTLHYEGWQGERSVAEKVPVAAPSSAIVVSNAPNELDEQSATKVAPPSMVSDRDSAVAAGNLAEQARKKTNTRTPGRTEIISSVDQPAAPAPMPAAKPAEPEQLAKTRNDAMDYTARPGSQTVAAESAAAIPMGKMGPSAESKAKDIASKNELHKEVQTAGAEAASATVLQDRKADTLSAQTVEVNAGASAKRSRVNDSFPRWTISAEGALQRSFDSGKNWQTIPVAGGAVFHTLSANDSDVWVGGAAGALYHSSDAGGHWSQIKPVANGNVLSADVASIEFSDPRHGKLTTSNHEIWITSDAGETWQKR